MALTLYNKGFSGWTQLGIFLSLWGVCIIFGSLLAAASWWLSTGQGILNMEHDMLRPQYANAVKIVQAISTFFMFLLPAVLYAFICYKNGWLALGFSQKPVLAAIGICLLILIAATPTIDALSFFNRAIPLSPKTRAFFDNIEKNYEAQVKVIGEVKTFGQYLFSLIMIGLLPALFEETLFRGGLQNMLARWWRSPWAAIVVTSIVFSAIHGSWYGFFPRIALGMVLGIIFHFTQNIWYNVTLHFINNALVVTIMYLETNQKKPETSLDNFTFPWWTAVFSVAIMVFLFRLLQKKDGHPAPSEIVYDRYYPFGNNEIIAKND